MFYCEDLLLKYSFTGEAPQPHAGGTTQCTLYTCGVLQITAGSAKSETKKYPWGPWRV